MNSKLHALTYIRNNRKRVAILIICLALFIGTQYGVSYFIYSNVSVSYAAGSDTFKKAALINIEPAALNIDADINKGGPSNFTPEIIAKYEEGIYEAAEKFEADERIIRAYPCTLCTSQLELVFGSWNFGGPLLTMTEIPQYLADMDAELIEGAFPEKPGDLLVDSKLARNMDCDVGDDISGVFQISGIVDCDIYLLTGLASDSIKESMPKNGLWLITDGSVDDASALAKDLGYTEDEVTVVYDYITEKNSITENMVNSYEASMSIVTIVLAFILCFCVLIVFILHIRDRYEEWCLYQSIGFSAKSIYFLAFRELIICFAAAVVCGVLFAAGIVTFGEFVIIRPKGLCADILILDSMINIGCLLLFIFGLLQLPIIHALSKTKTVDAIEEDL